MKKLLTIALGILLFTGCGNREKTEEADYAKKTVEVMDENPDKTALALKLESVIKPKESIIILTELADQGDAEAQLKLGFAYQYGDEFLKDEKKAFEWYEKAAEQGNAEAQFNLALAYLKGNGVLKDEKKAFEWFKKAAEQGGAEAQFKLGLAYKNGNGVLKDEKKAFEWIGKAADQELADAQLELGGMYLINNNKELARKWLRLSYENGNEEVVKHIWDGFNLGKY